MTNDKQKALMVYGIAILTVVLCVSAYYFSYSYDKCMKIGGNWQTISCDK